MANGKRKDTLIWGIILIAIGLLFLLDNIDIHIDVWHYLANFWPIILILWGGWKLYLGLQEARHKDEPAKDKK